MKTKDKPLPECYHINPQTCTPLEKPFVEELSGKHSVFLDNLWVYNDKKGRPVGRVTQDGQVYTIERESSGSWIIASGNGIKTRAAKGYLPHVFFAFTAWKKSNRRKSKKTSPIV